MVCLSPFQRPPINSSQGFLIARVSLVRVSRKYISCAALHVPSVTSFCAAADTNRTQCARLVSAARL